MLVMMLLGVIGGGEDEESFIVKEETRKYFETRKVTPKNTLNNLKKLTFYFEIFPIKK